MTTRTLTTILAALLALAIIAPAGATVDIDGGNWRQAAEPEVEITAYGNMRTSELWIAGRLPMDSNRSARSVVALTDRADIERNLDMRVLAADVNRDLAVFGIGPVNMYAGTKGADDAMVLLTSHGTDVWLFVFVMPTLDAMDAEAVVAWTVETMVTGVAATPGAGFVEMTMPLGEGGWA